MFLTSPTILSSELRTSSSDDLVGSQAGGKFIDPDKRLGIFIATLASRRAALNLRLARVDLLAGLFLVVASREPMLGPAMSSRMFATRRSQSS